MIQAVMHLYDMWKVFLSQGFAQINLVIIHKCRVSINAKVQARRLREERLPNVVCLAAHIQSMANVSQPMVLWMGGASSRCLRWPIAVWYL